MKLRYKFISIFLLFCTVLYANYPNFLELIPGLKKDNEAFYQQRGEQIQSALKLLQSIDLFLTEREQNRLSVLGNNPSAIQDLIKHPLLSYLFRSFTLQKEEEDFFLYFEENIQELTKITGDLNRLLLNTIKIENIEYREKNQEIFFRLKEGEQLTANSEPIRSFLGQELDWLYNTEESGYSSRKKAPDLLVNLGLDLKGGIYLDLDLDLELIFENIAKNLREDLRNYFTEQGIFYLDIVVEKDNSLTIYLDDIQNIDWQSEEIVNLLGIFQVKQQEAGVFIAEIPNAEKTIIQERSLDQVSNILNNRIDLLGVKEPSIQKKGDRSIIVQLPGQSDPARARRIIQQSAKLEFRFVVENADPDYPQGNLVLNYNIKDPITGEILDTERIVVEDRIALSGEYVREARVAYSQTTSFPYVNLDFNPQGAKKFSELTEKNIGRNLAIVLDNKIQSYPRINEAIYGGSAQITGNFSSKEATDLALVLRSGSLPTSLTVNEERTIGASLGEDSIQASMIALLLGFVFVIILLLIYYNLAGLFCIFALIFNILFIFAALSYFQATLTLPGMAGIILTIGMAVDANILIFERIKEELAHNNLHKAIGQGFSRSLWTILDANITTLLAAGILFYFGTGPIKGFSVTLSIGILASLFTSLFVSRFFFELFYWKASKDKKLSI